MFQQCPAQLLVPEELIRQARAQFPSDNETNWAYETLPCRLSTQQHQTHSAFLRDVPGDRREVFVFWRENTNPLLALLDYCGKQEDDPLEQCCTAYRGHPGVCTWAHTDLEARGREAFEVLVTMGLVTEPIPAWPWTVEYLAVIGRKRESYHPL